MALHPPSIPPGDDLAGIALCAGYGGLELGLHIAEPGYRTVCYVEREAHAAATLVARMADAALDQAPIWDDLRSFDGRPWRGRVHLVTAGYPCQPFSTAGRRLGQDDPRHLWPEVARIVRESGPEWVFAENVEGHLDLGLAEVVGELQGMGYRVKAGLFSAAEVGASHIRRRIFILAHADADRDSELGRDRDQPAGPAIQGRSDREGLAVRDMAGSAHLDAHVADHEGGRSAPDDGDHLGAFAPAPCDFATWEAILARHPEIQPVLLGLDHGLADWVERCQAAGNGVVPLAAAYAWRTLRAAHAADMT